MQIVSDGVVNVQRILRRLQSQQLLVPLRIFRRFASDSGVGPRSGDPRPLSETELMAGIPVMISNEMDMLLGTSRCHAVRGLDWQFPTQLSSGSVRGVV